MKAFLLAAGKGTRLRPLTFHIPKCLVPVNGKPLIEYWLDLFEACGIDEVLMNTSHLADKVRNYMHKHSRGISVSLTYEEKLLGSGGTVKKNWDFVRNENEFFILYADNLTNINLREMAGFHRNVQKDFTLAVFKVPNPRDCGVVELDEQSTVVSFREKPQHPASDLAFAGILLSSLKLETFFPDKEVFDLGYDVLPGLAGNAAGFVVKDYLIDIGTCEKLQRAEEDVRNNIFRPNVCQRP